MPVGHWNIVFGWVWMNLGFLSGLLMGLKVEQFGLNFQATGPTWMDGYDSIPRRLLRLGHIAFLMLPLLNIVYGQFIDGANLPAIYKVTGSYAMIFGAIGVPILCMAAAFYRPVKILLGIPASAVLLANLIIAWGYAQR
ncbi:MAG TPA: hypothetical protein V6D00_02290 [Pantanalinema sp.]